MSPASLAFHPMYVIFACDISIILSMHFFILESKSKSSSSFFYPPPLFTHHPVSFLPLPAKLFESASPFIVSTGDCRRSSPDVPVWALSLRSPLRLLIDDLGVVRHSDTVLSWFYLKYSTPMLGWGGVRWGGGCILSSAPLMLCHVCFLSSCLFLCHLVGSSSACPFIVDFFQSSVFDFLIFYLQLWFCLLPGADILWILISRPLFSLEGQTQYLCSGASDAVCASYITGAQHMFEWMSVLNIGNLWLSIFTMCTNNKLLK